MALVSTGLALVLRLTAAAMLGYTDREALFASYALYPQPAYLNHPGFIGMLARWLGANSAPTPILAHQVTAVWATTLPWLAGAASWALGASRRGVLLTVLAAIFAPELAIGSFTFTPDLPLTTAWLGALACAGFALRHSPTRLGTWAATLTAGLLVGIAGISTTSGLLLGAGILVAVLSSSERYRWRTAPPWLGALAAVIVIIPVFLWESQRGAPLLRHLFQRTDGSSDLSEAIVRLVTGQLVYVTPLYLLAAFLLLRNLWRDRHRNIGAWLLHCVTWSSALPLLALALWSGRGEPHWLMPCYLGILVYVGLRPVLTPALTWATLGSGALIVVLTFLWVTTPLAPAALGSSYSNEYDVANDMYSWGPGRQILEEALSQALLEEGPPVPVVGPHWTVCAQVRAALGSSPEMPVGCNTPWRDDFDDWLPRGTWQDAATILYVYDSRFAVDPERDFPNRKLRRLQKVRVRRGRQSVRTIYVATLTKREASATAHLNPRSEAANRYPQLRALGAVQSDLPP